jgi:hypothetical protein
MDRSTMVNIFHLHMSALSDVIKVLEIRGQSIMYTTRNNR